MKPRCPAAAARRSRRPAPARAFNGTQVTPTQFLIDGDGCMVRTGAGITEVAGPQRRIEGRLGG